MAGHDLSRSCQREPPYSTPQLSTTPGTPPEQKACCILLTLLHLGIKNIKLGPSLPAFVTPPVLNVLVENFGLAPITTPEEDLKAILG